MMNHLLSQSFGHQLALPNSVQNGIEPAVVSEECDDSNSSYEAYISFCSTSNKTFAAVVYETFTCQISLFRDMDCGAEFDTVLTVLEAVKPTMIITHGKQDKCFMTILREYCRSSSSTTSEASGSDVIMSDSKSAENNCTLKILPIVAFSKETTVKYLSRVDQRRTLDYETGSMQARFAVDMDAVNMMRALGGLLRFLDLNRSQLAGDLSSLVLNISEQNILDFTIIDDNTIRDWMKKPIQRIDILENRYSFIEYFSDDVNNQFLIQMQGSLKKIANLAPILSRMHMTHSKLSDWFSLYDTIFNLVTISESFMHRRNSSDCFGSFDFAGTGKLRQIGQLILRIINFEASREQDRFQVNVGIDTSLDNKKMIYRMLPDLLNQAAALEVQRLPEFISDCSVIYVSMVGFLLAVQKPPCWETIDDFKTLPNSDLVFTTTNTCHYKTPLTGRMNALFGDIKYEIIDRESSIMLRLQQIICQETTTLMQSVNTAAEIDCLLGFANASRDFMGCNPVRNDDDKMYVYKSRHLMQEMVVQSFVSNSVYSGLVTLKGSKGVEEILNTSKVTILTGPNACGKSVYLKQVGLLPITAQIGCYLPALSADLPKFDRVFTRIRTDESVRDQLSAFATDVKQMAYAVKNATGSSLVLIDEFGKGTIREVGAALLLSTLCHWINKGVDQCPHLFVSTHLHKLIEMMKADHDLRKVVTFKTFEVHEEDNDLVMLYRLIDGCSSKSYAIAAAEKYGLPSEIISRSRQVYENIANGEMIQPVKGDTAQTNLEEIDRDEMVQEFLDTDPSVLVEKWAEEGREMRRLAELELVDAAVTESRSDGILPAISFISDPSDVLNDGDNSSIIVGGDRESRPVRQRSSSSFVESADHEPNITRPTTGSGGDWCTNQLSEISANTFAISLVGSLISGAHSNVSDRTDTDYQQSPISFFQSYAVESGDTVSESADEEKRSVDNAVMEGVDNFLDDSAQEAAYSVQLSNLISDTKSQQSNSTIMSPEMASQTSHHFKPGSQDLFASGSRSNVVSATPFKIPATFGHRKIKRKFHQPSAISNKFKPPTPFRHIPVPEDLQFSSPGFEVTSQDKDE